VVGLRLESSFVLYCFTALLTNSCCDIYDISSLIKLYFTFVPVLEFTSLFAFVRVKSLKLVILNTLFIAKLEACIVRVRRCIQLSPRILRRYRVNHTTESMRRGDDVKFIEFVQYIIDSRSQPLNDFHWTPQTALCQPCRVHYDFIGHYETIDDDARYVLERIGVASRGFRFPRHGNRSTRLSERLRTAFAAIPATHIARLKQIYRADFAAFGYEVPVFDSSIQHDGA